MSAPPKKWLATLLSLVAQPLGLLYLGRPRLAGGYFLLTTVGALGVAFAWPGGMGFANLVAAVVGVTCAIHTYRIAKRCTAEWQRPGYSRWYGLMGAALGIWGAIFLVRVFAIEPFRLPSGSMQPTLELDTKVLVQKWGYGNYASFGVRLWRTAPSAVLKRGDIIVFEYPPNRSMDFVKRLVGLPGDKISYQDKRLYLNGQAVPTQKGPDYLDPRSMRYSQSWVESLAGVDYSVLHDEARPAYVPSPDKFAHHELCSYDAHGFTCEVPPGHFFMMGDNRDNSADSRYWGFVPEDHVVGKVVYVFQ